MNGFAAYDPDASRVPADDVISVRGGRAADLAVCAELIVSRTGGPAAERVELLRGDLEDLERYVAVACAGSGADEQVVGYGGVMRHERLAEHPLDLHERFEFDEVTRDFTFPRAPLQPGTGVLLRAPLTGQWKPLLG